MTTNTDSVGIGTNTPTRKIHLAAAGGIIRLSDGRIEFTDVGTIMMTSSTKLALSSTETDYLQFLAGRIGIFTSNAERMSVDGSGNVGIGTTSPTQKLDVVGEVKFSGVSAEVNKAVCVKGDGTLGTCSSAVDATGGCTCV